MFEKDFLYRVCLSTLSNNRRRPWRSDAKMAGLITVGTWVSCLAKLTEDSQGNKEDNESNKGLSGSCQVYWYMLI
jgi:hypothetical protein